MKATEQMRRMRTRTLRSLKVKSRSVEGCWPSPEDSVGEFITKIGDQSCWKADGPARAAFLIIGHRIKQYLDKCSESAHTWVTWSIYMVGDTPETAIPTIIFCCENEQYRKDIRDTIKNSNLLDGFP